MDISLNIDTARLEKSLNALPKKLSGEYIRDALQASGEVIRKTMQTLAPERTDEEMPPGSTSLPPGILRADLTAEVQITNKYVPRVKVGATSIASHVCRLQNEGWMLTGHGKKKRKIRQIPGKHFMEAAMDESGQTAVTVLVERLENLLSAEGVGAETDYSGENY